MHKSAEHAFRAIGGAGLKADLLMVSLGYFLGLKRASVGGRHTFTRHEVSVRYIIEGSNTVEEYSGPRDVSPLLQSMKLILQTRKGSGRDGHSESYDLPLCWCQLRTLPWVHAAGLKISNYQGGKGFRRSMTALGKFSSQKMSAGAQPHPVPSHSSVDQL